jgi:hypothetical protein
MNLFLFKGKLFRKYKPNKFNATGSVLVSEDKLIAFFQAIENSFETNNLTDLDIIHLKYTELIND